MSLCRVVVCVWDRRSAREGISAQVLRGHPSTDLGSFSTTVEYPWKPSSYVVPGDAAEDAAAAFLRTAWLTEYKGSPAPDEMWGCALAGLWLKNPRARALTMSPPGWETETPASRHREICLPGERIG